MDEQQLPRADMQCHLLIVAARSLREIGPNLFENSMLAFDVWGARYPDVRTLNQELTKSTTYYLEKKDRLSEEGRKEMLQHEAFVKELLLVVARLGAARACEKAEGDLRTSEMAGAIPTLWNLYCFRRCSGAVLSCGIMAVVVEHGDDAAVHDSQRLQLEQEIANKLYNDV